MTDRGALEMAFVTTSINYPVHRRRVAAFRSLGAGVQVVGFHQDLPYPPSPLDESIDASRPTRVLGVVRSGRYIRRALQLCRALPRVRGVAKSVDVVYAVGFDGALLAAVASLLMRRRPRLVYEVHDIRQSMLRPDAVGSIFRAVERWLTQKEAMLVVTARGYIDGYYRDRLAVDLRETFLLENKLEAGGIDQGAIAPPRRDPLRIGYFGSLRCEAAWTCIRELASAANGSIQVHVRGVPSGLADFRRDILHSPGVTYGGPYRDPDDIAALYRQVSVVWAAGFHGKDSHVWARSCRFYSACAYRRPIIAQTGTDEGRLVERLDIGCCVDLRDVPGTVARISSISDAELARWYDNLSSLPGTLYTYSNEHGALLDRLSATARQ